MSDHPQNPEIKLLDGEFYARDPHTSFRWMREHAPVYWDPQAEIWGIARHRDVLGISKNPAAFCSSGGSRPDSPPIPSMINLDDPLHRLRRALVNSGFTPRRVADHEPMIRRTCVELIDRVAPQGRCDFVRDIAAPLPMRVIGELLGIETEDHDMLLRWSDELLAGTSTSARPETAERAARAFMEYTEYNRKVVADRRVRPPGPDLMSVLVHAEIDGEKLGDDELLQEGLLILVGGDETTRHVISGGMEALLRRPEQLRELAADPARIPTAVEEMLRWVSPIQNMSRTATRETEIDGQKIREGEQVLLLYASANRDAAVFEDPFSFDAARSPNDHVAFGGYGAHFCLGASLARLELRVMFEELLRRIPDLELESDAALPLRPSNFIVGIEEMPVVFGPRGS